MPKFKPKKTTGLPQECHWHDGPAFPLQMSVGEVPTQLQVCGRHGESRFVYAGVTSACGCPFAIGVVPPTSPLLGPGGVPILSKPGSG